jgi:DNA-binding NtrC family response regulator
MRVLIADNDFNHNMRLAHVLESWGHVVQIAPDASEATRQQSSFVPDVILTSFPLTSADVPPAILVPAHESVEQAAEVVAEYNGFWFVRKPVSIEVLRVLLDRASEYGHLLTENARFRAEGAQQSLPIRVGMRIEEGERVLLEATLANVGNNKTHAARALGISTKTLHMKLRQYREQDARGQEAREEAAQQGS